MREYLKFYIDGQWVDPVEPKTLDVDNPTTEAGVRQDRARLRGRRRQGGQGRPQGLRHLVADHPRGAPRRCCRRILAEYQKRAGDLADAVTEEMGAPPSLAAGPQVDLGLGHLTTAIDVLKNFKFEEQRGATLIVKEPIGVCGLITPWNWPINQIACKVFPALATGCTMVLKPSEVAPYSAQIFTEIMDAAGVPAGVYNLVYGDGPGVGVALSSHPDIDMVSFTGSTRAGIEVAQQRRADGQAGDPGTRRQEPEHRARRRRLRQERRGGVAAMMLNSRSELQRAVAHAGARSRGWTRPSRSPREAAAEQVTVGDPNDNIGHRTGGLQGAVRQDPGPDPEGHRRGRHRGRRRPRPARRAGHRLLRQADGVRQRHQRHDDRARGDLRAGAVHPRLRRRRPGRRDRQRHRVRPGRLRLRRPTSTRRVRWPAGSAPARSRSTTAST